MTTVYKVLGQSKPSAATNTTLYTVPAANSAVISTITICNLTGNTSPFSIAIRPAGATIADQHYIAYNTICSGNDTVSLTLGLTLAATDVVTVYANSAVLTFNAFGSEIY